MNYLKNIMIAILFLAPAITQGLDFDPPLNEGIQFPETNLEETSTVEMTIRNNGNGIGLVLFQEPQNNVFVIEPLQVEIGGGQQAVMEFSFSPDEAGEVEERIEGLMLDEDMIQEISMILRGVGIEGDPSITVNPLEIELLVQEPGEHDEAAVTIGNEGEARLIFQVVPDEDTHWLTVEPLEGVVQVDEELELTLTTTDQLPERGIHETELIILSNDPENERVVVSVELNVDFFVELVLNREDVNVILEIDSFTEIEFEATNNGDARLRYNVERLLVGEADVDPWELQYTENFQDVAEDDQLNGVVFVADHYFISGGNNREDDNKIYVFNQDGELIRDFDQFHQSDYGMRDLCWDGELIWGADSRVLYGFNTDGEHIETIEGEAGSYRSLTWNYEDEVFISADVTSSIYITNLDGNLIETINRPGNLRFYGLAYWADDPDGYKLYVLSRGEDEGIDVRIYKVNLDNEDVQFVAEFGFDGGRPGGIDITNQYDPLSWVFVGIVQNPDRVAVWHIDGRRDWFRIEPVAGEIAAEGTEEFTLTLDATGLPEETFRGELAITIVGGGGQVVLPVTLEVVEGEVQTSRTLDLHLGWNMISTNLQPNEEDVEVLMADLVDQGILEMMKDGDGHFYRPDYNFNNIPGWSVDQGYQVKMLDEANLRLEGMSVLRDAAIQLEEGWQIVSYYPRFEIEATLALSGIEDHLIIAKDGLGNFYIPAWDYCNIGDMCEGQGYYMNVDEGVELIYVFEQGDALHRDDVRRQVSVYSDPGSLPVHSPTGANMSLLITANPSLTGEVAVFASDNLVGSGVLQDGYSGIAVWGDDKTTSVIDGADEGLPFDIKLYRDNELVEIRTTILTGEAFYSTNSYSLAKLEELKVIPEEYSVSAVYPNPFNAITTIQYQLPERSRVDISIFDSGGRLVGTLVSSEKNAGNYNVVWNALNKPTGIYLCKFTAGEFAETVKLILIK
ncbi:MAG: T9SS type A sorting domain-containing protein [Candidatus Hatepunaea meridiana]|nr:T9SS type A sorting domain-containing protein [Candidatus Hatepunaea meridiana]